MMGIAPIAIEVYHMMKSIHNSPVFHNFLKRTLINYSIEKAHASSHPSKKL